MSALDVYAPRAERFRKRMLANLARPKNVAKPDWRALSLVDLIAAIEEELAEVKMEMEKGSFAGMVDESADLGNAVMMLFDVATEMNRLVGGPAGRVE
jgi:hypothetical protein